MTNDVFHTSPESVSLVFPAFNDSSYHDDQTYPDFNLYIPDFLLKYFAPLHRLNRALKTAEKYLGATELGLSVAGALANIVTMCAFVRMGLGDTINAVLFNIAVSDFSHLAFRILEFYIRLRYHNYMESEGMEDPKDERIKDRGFEGIFPPLQSMMILANALLTTFLAVQRCLCVVKPLQFKGMFTRRRTLIVVWTIWGYCLLSNVPRFSQFHLRVFRSPVYNFSSSSSHGYVDPYHNDVENRTRTGGLLYYKTGIYLSRKQLYFDWVDPYTKLINSSILLFVCQATVISCIFSMSYSLKKYANFRQKSTLSPLPLEIKADARVFSEAGKVHATNNGDEKSKSFSGSAKCIRRSMERQVIVQVILVSVIFVLAHLHKTVYEICWRFTAGSVIHQFGNKLYGKFNCYFYILNSSVNIFVYLKYNAKFRQSCFWTKREVDK